MFFLSHRDFHVMFSTGFGIVCPNTDLVFDSYLIQAIIRISKDIWFVILVYPLDFCLQWLEVALSNSLTTWMKEMTWRVVWKIGWDFSFERGYLNGIVDIKWL